MAKAYMPFIKVYWPQKSQAEEKPMRYRVESESKWYKTLHGAKNRAIDVQRGREITVNVVDERGVVVWSTPKITVKFIGETHVKPNVQPQQEDLL